MDTSGTPFSSVGRPQRPEDRLDGEVAGIASVREAVLHQVRQVVPPRIGIEVRECPERQLAHQSLRRGVFRA